MLQQVAEGLGGDDPQVDRDPVLGLRPHPVGAGFPRRRDQRAGDEVLGQLLRLGGGGDQVDVLAGLSPAPHRAGNLDPVGRWVLAQQPRQLLGDRPGHREQHATAPLPGLAEALEAGQDVFLRLRSEALHLADPFALCGGPEVIQGRDAELVEEPSRRLCPHPRHPRHFDQGGRELRLQLHRRGDLAGLEQGVDLFRQRLADAGDLGRPPRRRQVGDRDRAFADRLCRRAVGQHAVFDRPVELVEDAELLQRGGDFGVGHTPSKLSRWQERYPRPRTLRTSLYFLKY